ncbi:hypothetical protein [Mycobacterium sp. 1274756.6]|uniref:hypothetical protein n=1 Tax=Mycobacterium sp. 1274756.6 TaxID=1834076 RepID=UPI0007FBB4BB|nr:hypothetical protein [Mycobacterium sp. 1274756.6]OBJ73082.1 hypothetical protein A5643_04620 [Mycobacterium sp. 1274756.6]
MRLVATALLWLVATAALAVAVPAVWAQRHLVDTDGYGTLAAQAAQDPDLQAAVAAQLTTQAMRLPESDGADSLQVHDVAVAYTAGPEFPTQFARVNRAAHRWLFTGAGQGEDLRLDVAPMLEDSAFRPFLDEVPATVTVPVTATPDAVQSGQLRALRVWGPAVSIGASLLAALAALGVVVLARRRGSALAWLGVSALLVGASGWAGIEVGRGRLDEALNSTAGDIRRIAEIMVDHAIGSLHHWLNLTLAGGGILVAVGVLTGVLGGLRRSD